MNEVLRQLKTRILVLGGKVSGGTATDEEMDEYRQLLSDFDKLTKTSIAAEEVEARKEDNDIKSEQLKEQRKDRIVRTVTTAVEVLVPLATGVCMALTAMKVDLTSVMGRRAEDLIRPFTQYIFKK